MRTVLVVGCLIPWLWATGCSDGGADCTYDTDCPDTQVCRNRGCKDLCEGTSCTVPPGDPACFDLPAPCEQGACRYAPVAGRTCDDADACTRDDACSDEGNCAGAPLACDQPPAAECKDAGTLTTFASPGVCANGLCSYPFEDTQCPHGCSGGQCGGCTPEWIDTGACGCAPTECVGCDGTKPQEDGCGNSRDVACSLPPTGCAGPCCQQVCCQASEVCQGATCCLPVCAGRECGPDGCGGACGTCPPSFACQPDGTCLLQSTCAGPPAPGPTAFGFNYAPQGYLCKWAGTDFQAAQAAFEADLAVMASLGTRTVRIMLLPYCLGLVMAENAGPGNWDPAELDAMAVNLPAIIERFGDFGISVVPALGPNAYYWNGPSADQRWWEWVYGPGAGGWGDFVQDTVDWGTRVVEIVETSAACSNVLYYDLHNEVDYYVPDMASLITAQLRDTPVPDAKRGLSILRSLHAADLASDVAASGNGLAFLEFHVYPDRNLHNDVPGTAVEFGAHFPGVPLLVGEFGSIFCENGQDEDAERDTTLSVLDGADAAGVVAALHWMLWDRDPGTTCIDTERVGLGYDPHQPRDVFGALAEREGLIPDADFENGPGGWYVGGETPSVALHLGGPTEADAATNQHYGRMQIEAEGHHWFCGPQFDTAGGQLAVSGYVRSNLQILTLGAHFYDASQEIGQASVPMDLPGDWSFNNLQMLSGGHAFDVPPGTSRCIVCVSATAPAGTSAGNPVYVDLDTFSAHGFDPR